MYGLPPNFDATGFIGKTLDLLVVGKWQLTLRFSEDCTINIEGKIAVNSEAPIYLPNSLAAAYQLINQVVDSASGTEDGTLTLHFGNGSTLRVFDSQEKFESYNFNMNGEGLIVV